MMMYDEFLDKYAINHDKLHNYHLHTYHGIKHTQIILSMHLIMINRILLWKS